jgi:hypothetical protein
LFTNYLPRRIAPVAPATSIPFQAAKAHWEPFPNLRGFVADEDKEFQASLARDRAENL